MVRNVMMKRATGAAALLLLPILVGCGDKARTSTATHKDVPCETGEARLDSIPQLVIATGSLEATKTVMVSTRMMGWVRQFHVEEGQTVAKGDRLVSIDDTDLRAKRRQAEAGLAEARAVHANAEKMATRFENLYAEKSVSKQQLDDVLTGRDRALSGVAMAEAGLSELQVHLNYLSLTAPCAGVVARRLVEEGDMANPGMPLLMIEQTGAMKVVAQVGEKDVSKVAAGIEVAIDVTSLPGAVFTAPLDKVITSANPGSRTYDIEAMLDNADGRLKSGMFARVSVPVGRRQAVLVPAAAIHPRGQLNGVWVVRADGTAQLRWVRVGNAVGDDVEILSGLAGTETVVVKASAPLAEGDKVVR